VHAGGRSLSITVRDMRRLRHHQQVEIHLDVGDEDEVIPCRVERVEGSVATLKSLDGAGLVSVGNATPAFPGYLVFDHGGLRVALKGIATNDASDRAALLFVVIDGVQLPERRSAERVEIDALARLHPGVGGGDGTCVETRLADLSISGMRVARHPALVPEGRYRLELHIRNESRPIECEAQVARTTPTHVGMKFIDVQEADRALLAAIVASRRSYSEAA
jgi:PilZ domain